MLKRFLDLSLIVLSLPFLLPFFLIIMVLVWVKLGTPIFFRQIRPGKDTSSFSMLKFRTMSDARDENGCVLSDSLRLTTFGKILRSTSLDELPGLWNVFKGDMSLVGPRPLLVEYLPLYTSEQSRRHEVKPGITGWAQVNGRNAISWEEKFKLDVWYVDNQSIWLDMKILWLTIKKVLSRENVTEYGEATMSKFTGSVK